MQSEHVTEIHFDADQASRGLFVEPQPVFPPHAAVIVVERDSFLVGLWEEDCFVHPANQRELAGAAEAAVRSAFPQESFAFDTLRIFTCPAGLAAKFDWNWTRRV